MEQPNQSLENPAVQPSAGLSFRGVFEVFYKPAAFFDELKAKPKVLVPYVVLAVLAFAIMFLLKDLILETQFRSPQFQEQMQGQTLTPEIRTYMMYSTVIGGALASLLIPLLEATLMLFWGNFVFAGKASFRQLLSVSLYGCILFFAGGLVTVPMMLAKDSVTATLSLGVFAAGQGPESFWFVLLSKIGVFNIWEIIVVGIGLAAVYNVPRNKGYLLAVLSPGLLSALQIVLTGVSKLFF